MKKKFFLYSSFTLLLMLMFSCSDWEQDPTSVTGSESVEEEPSGVLMSTNIPRYMSAFYIGTDNVCLVGTTEGVFYKSNDKGLSWKVVGEMQDKNQIYFFARYADDPKYFIAGTKTGGYLSTDCGSSWKEILQASNEFGYGELKLGSISKNKDKIRISFFSRRQVVRDFISSDFGATWSTNGFSQKFYASPIADCEEIMYMDDLAVFNGKTQSAVNCGFSSVKTILYNENMEFTSVIRSSHYITSYNAGYPTIEHKYFYSVGSKRGIFTSRNIREGFDTVCIPNRKIYSIVFSNSGGQFFAGTSDGLYISLDGLNWANLELFDKEESVVKTILYGNYLYLVTGSGYTYYFKLFDDNDKSLFLPVLITPSNNEVCKDSPMLKWNMTGYRNSVMYKIQISKDTTFKTNLIDERILKNYYQTNLLEKNTKYYWRVRSEKVIGISDWSNISSFVIK